MLTGPKLWAKYYLKLHHLSHMEISYSHIERINTTPRPLPRWLIADLRSDHAGETGAVAIYRGILAVSSDPDVRQFAGAHLAIEESHLAIFNRLLPSKQRSVLLPLWRLAGFITGALPALFGANATYATIEAVETFVDKHYQQQIDRLAGDVQLAPVRDLLESCRQDEVDHRDDAASRRSTQHRFLMRCWIRIVGSGSAGAVALARLG